MFVVIWSEPAKEDYWQNIDFLLQNWQEKQVRNFIQAVDKHIGLIQENPKLFALTDYQNIRSVLIVKQITLFYRIENNAVELIRFWNNHQNPKRLKI